MKKSSKNRGAFLITTLLLSIIIFIIASALCIFVIMQAKSAKNQLYEKEAKYSSLAGIKYAAAVLGNLVPPVPPSPPDNYENQYKFDFLNSIHYPELQAIVNIVCDKQTDESSYTETDPKGEVIIYTHKYKITSTASLCRGTFQGQNFIASALLAKSKQTAIIWIREAALDQSKGDKNPGRTKIIYMYDDYKQ